MEKKFDLDIQKNAVKLQGEIQPNTIGTIIRQSLRRCPTAICISFGCGNK
ncbi:type A lantibiotic [Neobacillus sp. OS1-32]|nr:type A lantibiotic [Neobacillus sp. OS1-32]WML30050.1 type A lantibiotic [Neobacillus sp. OS1-32]